MVGVPKPLPRKKRHTWLRKMGDQAHKWETFKQCVVYPFLYFGMQLDDPAFDNREAGIVTMRCQCEEDDCEQVVKIELFATPDKDGKWWRMEGEVDHKKRRSQDAGGVFTLANCRALAVVCHRRRRP